MNIRSFGFVGVALAGALVLAAGSAQAGGMGDRSYASPPAPIWAGMYAGADLGFAYANADVSWDVGYGPYSYSGSASGSSDNEFVGGLIVGYNIQHGSTVYGIEGDVNFVNGGTLSSVRGRYGVINNGWLLYGTAGLGIISDDYDSRTGWVAGAGVETKLSPNLTAGLEGLYYDFGEDHYGADYGLAYAHATVDWSVVSMRGRLTYQLDRGRDYLK